MTVEHICSRRRQRLLQALQPGEIALVPAAQLQLRNGDVHHAFRQSSDLRYLTEFPEPDALLLLHRAEDGDRQLLFCKSKDPLKERWDGPIAGPELAMRDYGLPEALPLSAMAQQLPALLSGAANCCIRSRPRVRPAGCVLCCRPFPPSPVCRTATWIPRCTRCA